MAASIPVEEERGTYVRSPQHPHNGYYAGDFGPTSLARPLPSATAAGLPRR